MLHRLVALTVLALASACTPAARLAATQAAIDCGGSLVTSSAPTEQRLLGAAACWLDRFAAEGLEVASLELGEAVGEAAEAALAEQAEPSPEARKRTDAALDRCRAISQPGE